MKASCGTEIASMREAVGEKIVGRQLECGRTAFQLYIYIYDDDDYVYITYHLVESATYDHEPHLVAIGN